MGLGSSISTGFELESEQSVEQSCGLTPLRLPLLSEFPTRTGTFTYFLPFRPTTTVLSFTGLNLRIPKLKSQPVY